MSLPSAPATRQYSQRGCGDRRTLSVRHGISVGWGDRYGYELRYQAIDASPLPPGEYLLKITVDPSNFFIELNDTNNCNWTKLRIPSSSRQVVTVLDWGTGCLPPGVTPTPAPGLTAQPSPTTTPTPSPAATPIVTATPTPLDETGGSG